MQDLEKLTFLVIPSRLMAQSSKSGSQFKLLQPLEFRLFYFIEKNEASKVNAVKNIRFGRF